jgi:hypothetical protein
MVYRGLGPGREKIEVYLLYKLIYDISPFLAARSTQSTDVYVHVQINLKYIFYLSFVYRNK